MPDLTNRLMSQMKVTGRQEPIRRQVGPLPLVQQLSVSSSVAFSIPPVFLFPRRAGWPAPSVKSPASPHISVVSSFSAQNRREHDAGRSGRKGILALKLSYLWSRARGREDLFDIFPPNSSFPSSEASRKNSQDPECARNPRILFWLRLEYRGMPKKGRSQVRLLARVPCVSNANTND